MAVLQVGGGGGVLGTLGKIAGLGGMLIPGAGWLTPLGMGLGAADAAINGNPQGAVTQLLSGMARGQLGQWMNPAAGTLAKAQDEAALAQWRDAYERIKEKEGWEW